jgi:hypothetical protein
MPYLRMRNHHTATPAAPSAPIPSAAHPISVSQSLCIVQAPPAGTQHRHGPRVNSALAAPAAAPTASPSGRA